MANRPFVAATISNHRVLHGPRVVSRHSAVESQPAPMLASARWAGIGAVVSLGMWIALIRLIV